MSQRQIAQKQIESLILKFRQNEDSYRNGSYNETQLRREFLDPFFEALGWDVINKQGLAEQYKDVIHEDAIKVGEQTKAPDYSFRVGGQRKFFVEAKKPSVSIKEDIGPAYQIRRYSWSAKLPLALLSDFDELAVYDCRQKPKPADKASVGRVAFYTYDQYLEKFDEIYDLFSKEAVLKGAFDKFAQADAKKKGTTEVDKEFLKDIEHWRELLAKSIALRNDKLSNNDLNYAVQTIIDRIIFLRICEDRNLEAQETLKGLLSSANIYKRLISVFKQADDRYNAGLFDFNKDQITTKLKIDDKTLNEIIGQMYYPASPYVFSQMPIEILGQVYEQFLGKVIRLTAGHHAKVEEKPEVRKAGGVYYTPQYIVDYIVKNTVGALLDPKSDPSPTSPRSGERLASLTPKEIESIKILDPACGSGSFLIGAYKYLLEYHLNWYTANEPKKYPKAVFTDGHGAWRLTTSEAKKILLNNIFGVDIDSQAVEVTKLSLLLKVLENESREGMEQQLKIFKERALPNIDGNIKCGNSLIGPDFYQGQLDLSPALPSRGGSKGGVSNEDGAKINPFDWEREFPEIMKRGGFDVVVGNPPYGAEFDGQAALFMKNKYKTFSWRGESYMVFVEKAISLLRKEGHFGYILPDTYLNLGFTQALRDYIAQTTKIKEIVSLPSKVFAGATVDTTLLFVEKAEQKLPFNQSKAIVKVFNKRNTITSVAEPDRMFTASIDSWHKQRAFNISSDSNESKILTKADCLPKFDEFVEMFSGIKVYEVGKGTPPQKEQVRDSKPFTSVKRLNKDFYPLFDGKHIGRYTLLWKHNNWVKYGPWLAAPRDPVNFVGEKIVIRKIVSETLVATYIQDTSYCNTLLHVLKIKPDSETNYLYLLGILNSKFIGWYFRKKFQISADDTFPQIMIRDILQFPIPKEKGIKQKNFETLAKQMLNLNNQLSLVKNPNEKETLTRQIAATDKQIDKLVYELYGLTEEEIKVVEGE